MALTEVTIHTSDGKAVRARVDLGLMVERLKESREGDWLGVALVPSGSLVLAMRHVVAVETDMPLDKVIR